MFEEAIIEYVRGYEFLYNPRLKEYRNQLARMEAWEEMGNKLGISGKECKDSWTRLRNAYTNARKRRKTTSGQAAKNLSKWKFEEQMAFLAPFMEPRVTNGNANTADDSGEDDLDPFGLVSIVESNREDFTDEAHYAENAENSRSACSTPKSPTPPETPQQEIPIKGQKRRIIESSLSDMVKIIQENSHIRSTFNNVAAQQVICATDEIELLFLSMARNVKKLSPEEQAIVKLEISNSVFQAELRDIRRQKSSMLILPTENHFPQPLKSPASSHTSRAQNLKSEAGVSSAIKETLGTMLKD